ncbi:hypothetical protein [Streptomyces sp. TLI_105]|uniref:hypothetical protein n=1 Tax=Streptomyces sp. TLI_105 TaxID=1881019 RepID=UPI000899B67F|nr:hypothetical protein [Streptomyces sp. TLI_105]SED16870.1 hypothetical protein SAMN05428939_4406 [Streptomyces sp. TLI_105]
MASPIDAPASRPAVHAPYIHVLFLAPRGIHGFARYCAGDLKDPEVWRIIREGAAHHLGRDGAARLPGTGSSRHQRTDTSAHTPNSIR